MAFLEFIGAAILLLAILGISIWVRTREQGFLRGIARRSRADAIAAQERAAQYRARQQYGQYGPPPGQAGPPEGRGQ